MFALEIFYYVGMVVLVIIVSAFIVYMVGRLAGLGFAESLKKIFKQR